jgi:hypothetical protein
MLRVCFVFDHSHFLEVTHLLCLTSLPLVFSVLTPFALIEDSMLEQIDFGATIHAAFTEVSVFHTFVLDERSSDAPSTHLSWTDVVANG